MADLNIQIQNSGEESRLSTLITSARVASGDDYLLTNVTDLHNRIEEVLSLDLYHPKYQIWRVFLYRYLYAKCDILAAEKFAKTFIENDRNAYRIPNNRTSKTIENYINRLRTTSSSIFNGTTSDDFTEVLNASSLFLNNENLLLNIIQSDLEFKAELENALNIDSFHSIYIAYLLIVCRSRWIGFDDTNAFLNVLPKWEKWCNAYKSYFCEFQQLLGEKVGFYTFYDDVCKKVIFRMLDASVSFLKTKKIVGVSEIYGVELDMIDTLSRDFIIDLVSTFPLYTSIYFDLYNMWNILYNFYFTKNQTILDYYRLFLIEKRLYLNNMKAIDNLNYYIRHNDIGLECIKLRKIELFNANVEPEYAEVLLNEYFDDLVIRGIINKDRREEVLYAVRKRN